MPAKSKLSEYIFQTLPGLPGMMSFRDRQRGAAHAAVFLLAATTLLLVLAGTWILAAGQTAHKPARIFYVNPEAQGRCTSWEDACGLHMALGLASPGDQVWVANRTFENGVELARQFNGQAIRFEEIPEFLKAVDIIISSTASPEFVIRSDQLKGINRQRKNRPLFFIDIAVPRDIDPDINRMSNCYVYDIDDLKGIIDENIEDRQKEAIKGERMVDEAVIRFREWYESLDVVPTIIALRQKMTEIAEAELKKTLQASSLSQQEAEAIRKMADSLINKILHDPTRFLKRNGMREDRSVYIDSVRKLFNLDE